MIRKGLAGLAGQSDSFPQVHSLPPASGWLAVAVEGRGNGGPLHANSPAVLDWVWGAGSTQWGPLFPPSPPLLLTPGWGGGQGRGEKPHWSARLGSVRRRGAPTMHPPPAVLAWVWRWWGWGWGQGWGFCSLPSLPPTAGSQLLAGVQSLGGGQALGSQSGQWLGEALRVWALPICASSGWDCVRPRTAPPYTTQLLLAAGAAPEPWLLPVASSVRAHSAGADKCNRG